ncbi:anti-sigma factor [Glutamicibacter protophormiae]|uniref:anti-sigma factor n=1 Tax=Glutamicibacter protophormiae TaxID=37930 RepID=UPI00332A586A
MEPNENELTGSYALHALGEEERARLLALAAGSPELKADMDSMDETAAMLALGSAPVPPPAGVKSRLMEEIARRPQLPADGPAGQDPQAGPAPAADPVPGRQTRPARRGSAKFFALAAAILLLGSAGLGTVVYLQQAEQRELQAQLTDLGARQSEFTALLGAPDVKTKTQAMADGASVTLSYSVERGLMAVTTAGMPELPRDKGYELWLISADGAQPAGMLPGADADGLKLVSGAMDGISHFGITVEPAAGSPAPTTEPLMVQEL